MTRFIWPLLGFVLLVVFLAIGLQRDPRELPSPLLGQVAPGFTLPVLGREQSFSPEQMRGQVWLLNVWASWCVSCRQEHPVLLALQQENHVPIIGLNYKEIRGDSAMDASAMDAEQEYKQARQRAANWLQERGNPYTLSVLDLDGRVAMDYGVYGVPETYVIDKKGVVRLKHVGPLTAEVVSNKILPQVAELNR